MRSCSSYAPSRRPVHWSSLTYLTPVAYSTTMMPPGSSSSPEGDAALARGAWTEARDAFAAALQVRETGDALEGSRAARPAHGRDELEVSPRRVRRSVELARSYSIPSRPAVCSFSAHSRSCRLRA